MFDGVSGLRSKKTQNEIYAQHRIKIHAEPFYKRNMAERAIKEIKLRMAIFCELDGKYSLNDVNICYMLCPFTLYLMYFEALNTTDQGRNYYFESNVWYVTSMSLIFKL